MGALREQSMTVEQFLDWWDSQSGDDRYELVDGKVVAMVRDTVAHNRAKLAAVTTLANAIVKSGAPCEAFIDGIGVSQGSDWLRIPDAVVHCGEALDEATSVATSPIIAVEVVSPSSEERDAHVKLTEYFEIDTIEHYLICYPEKALIVHHRRLRDKGTIETVFCREGVLELNPPGLQVDVRQMLGPGAGEDAADA